MTGPDASRAARGSVRSVRPSGSWEPAVPDTRRAGVSIRRAVGWQAWRWSGCRCGAAAGWNRVARGERIDGAHKHATVIGDNAFRSMRSGLGNGDDLLRLDPRTHITGLMRRYNDVSNRKHLPLAAPVVARGTSSSAAARNPCPRRCNPLAGDGGPLMNKEMSKHELLARISIDANVCFGKPCIRGHRIWVSLVLDLLASGWTVRDLLEQYPGIEEADVLACIAYGAEMSRERYVDVPLEASA